MPKGANATSSMTDAGQKCQDTKQTNEKVEVSMLSLSLSLPLLCAVACLQPLSAAMAGTTG